MNELNTDILLKEMTIVIPCYEQQNLLHERITTGRQTQ